jgi:hypothetical protein
MPHIQHMQCDMRTWCTPNSNTSWHYVFSVGTCSTWYTPNSKTTRVITCSLLACTRISGLLHRPNVFDTHVCKYVYMYVCYLLAHAAHFQGYYIHQTYLIRMYVCTSMYVCSLLARAAHFQGYYIEQKNVPDTYVCMYVLCWHMHHIFRGITSSKRTWYACLHVRMYVCMNTSTKRTWYACMYVCMHACMYVL